MTVYCFGSINIDHTYRVPCIPSPGETLSATSVLQSLGGKGANTSIAMARAGADVRHIGCISRSQHDEWVLEALVDAGVDIRYLARSNQPTGHAIVQVAGDGENAITIFAGANDANDLVHIEGALESAKQGDWFVLQNETNNCVAAAKAAKAKGLRVGYVAAPFDVSTLLDIIDHVDLIAMNEHEAASMEEALGQPIEQALFPDALITLGGKGAKYVSKGHQPVYHPAFVVSKILDTTCAGDTYFGYFVSSLSMGEPIEKAMRLASAAASLVIQRSGASISIPTFSEVNALL